MAQERGQVLDGVIDRDGGEVGAGAMYGYGEGEKEGVG